MSYLRIILSLLAAYIFVSLAIDRGSLWLYLLAIICAVYGLKYLWRAGITLKNHGKKRG